MTPIDKWIEDVRARLGAATPGPWETQSNCDYRVVTEGHVICESSPKADFSHGMTLCIANSNLIAHAPSDLSRALEEIERLTKCPLEMWECAKSRREYESQITQLQKQVQVLREGLKEVSMGQYKKPGPIWVSHVNEMERRQFASECIKRAEEIGGEK